MKYFIDTEFNEDFHKPLFGRKRHFIDLISIGIVCEDGREYYAISKDFDVDAAWNKKDDWLRENVLKTIFVDLLSNTFDLDKKKSLEAIKNEKFNETFHLKDLKRLIKEYGKSNKQIAEEIKYFITGQTLGVDGKQLYSTDRHKITGNPEFYGYYADYDWVLFCSLFGTMMNLPEGFPMYCNDLKQVYEHMNKVRTSYTKHLTQLKDANTYPVQFNEHNALYDAKWNFELYKFLNRL